jgi:hypothetical protein
MSREGVEYDIASVEDGDVSDGRSLAGSGMCGRISALLGRSASPRASAESILAYRKHEDPSLELGIFASHRLVRAG